jgi:hypothetical protein
LTVQELMRTSLAAAVPLWIAEVSGWSTERRLATARECADVVASKGDVLQFGGKRGEAAAGFNALARGLACCADLLLGESWIGVKDCGETSDGRGTWLTLRPKNGPDFDRTLDNFKTVMVRR